MPETRLETLLAALVKCNSMLPPDDNSLCVISSSCSSGAEAFNLLNHPNFGYIDPYLTDATFGEATQMLNQSLGTLASQYQQGGPRSMQFALKLIY